ncbi:MAG: hypothetical protein GX988_04940 [Clostridiales bacterium]|nr:hypothetical protein [Clostridiales bacterium]
MYNLKCKSLEITDELLVKLNNFTRRKHSIDEVYIFSVVLCDNEIDRDNERFSIKALEKLSELFVGRTGIFDHNAKGSNQTARIFDCCVEVDKARKTSFGEEYTFLKALAYMVKTNANTDLIKEIDAGIKKEVSVSCSVARQNCSICGANLKRTKCSHRIGKSYGGEICHCILDEPTDAYEWSFVAVPSQREAGVTKSHRGKFVTGVEKIKSAHKGISLTAEEVREIAAKLDEFEEMSIWAKNYRDDLQKEIVRLAFIACPYIPKDLVKATSESLSIPQLKELRNAYANVSTNNVSTQLIGSTEEIEDNESFKL